MEWYEFKVDGAKSVKFPEKVFSLNPSITSQRNEEKLGGFLQRGELAWLAKDSLIQIVSVKNGNTVSLFEFAESKGYDNYVIKCVEQITFGQNSDELYLAICLNSITYPDSSLLALYSVDRSIVLRCIELKFHVACCRFLKFTIGKRSVLQNFESCLLLGCMDATVVLLELRRDQISTRYNRQSIEEFFTPCCVIDNDMLTHELHENYKQCHEDGIQFGLQVKVADIQSSVQCILPLNLNLNLAIGLENGCLLLYDLILLQTVYVATPNPQCMNLPLVRMDFLEPSDDPRPCFYIWALHEGNENLHAVLHSFMYEKRIIKDHNYDNSTYLKTFQSSCVGLTISLDSGKCKTLACQAITKSAVYGEEDSTSLCALSWHSEIDQKNKLLIFDLNQWYKEEMPFCVDVDGSPSYLAAYILTGQNSALELYINPTTIAYFNSIQRLEEHFYPNSLSFDCCALMQNSCFSYIWEGVQNRFINMLRLSNATVFLEPNAYFNEILRINLLPQFCELSAKAKFSTQAKYEVILSVALEYNCFSLLRDCAKSWFDGSFMGNSITLAGISLSTLTDWIWKRATDIKIRCNDLCKCLFDFVGFPLDQREQKELGFISRQLKLLANLLGEVLKYTNRNVSTNEYKSLEFKYKSLDMASKYQDILLWLLNIGLLPEASPYRSKVKSDVELVPYPFKILNAFYTKKRAFLGKSNNFISKKSGSCHLLYIDAFIEHECKGNILKEYWMENDGNGLYPPSSIESMLRILLLPDMLYESKCAVLLYFFLDLNMAINNEAYKNVVANFIKFPSVFKLSASLIKTVQAFWNLDHGHFLPAVDEFLSPFNKSQNYPQWLIELMIQSLLAQDASNLALRILESHSSLISPFLKLQTLLSSELISEAFHFVRSKNDEALLEQFFKCCLCNGKFGVIRDLALSEKEGQLLQNILKCSTTQHGENLHFVYLLQKSKYIEALSYMEEISKSKCMSSYLNSTEMNTPNLVMSAYSTTVTPVTHGLTDVYFRIKNKIRKKEMNNKSPVPLSCQLIKHNANQLLGGIYHSSALSAHFATYYWNEMDGSKRQPSERSALLSSNNAPFLRKPQATSLQPLPDFLDDKNTICYPQAYKLSEKRTLAEADMGLVDGTNKLAAFENPRKRRKILSDDIVKEVSQFVKMSKRGQALSNSDFNYVTGKDSGKTSNMNVDNFLTQPPPLISQTSAVSEKCTDLHGILKLRTPEPSERRSMSRDAAIEEETKNIRFNLPVLKETMEIEENPEMNAQPAADGDQENLQQNIGPKKTFARSVSVDSSSSCSSKALSDENFYSPVSSENNSLVADRLSQAPESGHRTSISLSCSAGPTEGKPLIRTTAESQPTRDLIIHETSQCVENILPENSADVTEDEHYENVSSAVNFQTSSDFISSVKQSLTENIVAPANVVCAVISEASNIKDFEPQVSSSKVCETQSNFIMEEVSNQEKLSEKSTVVDTATYTELVTETSKVFDSVNELTASTTKKTALHELDTTLGMSSYDFTILETTSVQETKTFLLPKVAPITATPATTVNEEPFKDESKNQPSIYADLETDSQDEIKSESNVLFDVSMGLDDNLHNEISNSSNSECNNSPSSNEHTDDVIVLSSSENDDSNGNSSSVYEKSYSTFDDDAEESEDEGSIIASDVADDDDDDDDATTESDGDMEIDGQLIESTILSTDESQVSNKEAEVSNKEAEVSNKEAEVSNKEADGEEVADKLVETTEAPTKNTAEDKKEDKKEIDSYIKKKSTDSEDVLNSKETQGDAQSHHSCNEQNANLQDVEEPITNNIDSGTVLKDIIKQKEADEERVDEGSNVMCPSNKESQNSFEEAIDGPDNVREKVLDDLLSNNDIDETNVTKAVADCSKKDVVNTSQDLLPCSSAAVEDISVEVAEYIETQAKETLNVENVELDNDFKSDSAEQISSLNESKEEIVAPMQSEADITVDTGLKSLEKDCGTIDTNKKDETNIAVDANDEQEEDIERDEKEDSNNLAIGPSLDVDSTIVTTSIEVSACSDSAVFSEVEVATENLIESNESREDSLNEVSVSKEAASSSGCTPERTETVLSHNDSTKADHKVAPRKVRGASVPPESATPKPVTNRRRSALLEPIIETGLVDSPSSRTRSKSRLNLMDSELDTSLVLKDQPVAKRTRKSSFSSSFSEQAEDTPTQRTLRSNSISSQSESGTPITRRARSSASLQEEYRPTRATSGLKRRIAVDKSVEDAMIKKPPKKVDDQHQNEDVNSTGNDVELNAADAYSSSRRLTRTQLAMMEKTAALASSYASSATLSKRVTKRRTSNSTAKSQLESDDAESIASYRSGFSSATGSRRLTRSSVKDKDESEDDLVSVAGSASSAKSGRKRTKLAKHSPGTQLSAIPEVDERRLEPKKRTRRTKKS